MAKILGLDLGTNSIGWSLIDDEKNQILGMGSRIFQEGVIDLGQGDREMSKNASRTGDRGIRRQFFRRRLRKKILLRELSKYGMCPLTAADIEEWKETKVFPESKLKEWFATNPYELRAASLNEKLTLLELGRVLYHLIQRRGFQSNSRSAGEEAGAIFDGKEGKIGISQTQESIKSSKTLGLYLNNIRPKDNQPFINGLERVRNRYTTRQMYIDEFELIWEKQKVYHSQLNEELKTILGGRRKDGYEHDGVLFHQRPLRSQKHLVGKCSFEPSKTKSPISAVEVDKFRVYQWVNTVDCNVPLDENDRLKLIDQLLRKEKIKFSQLRKLIKRADSNYQFNYKDDDEIVGTLTISKLSGKNYFGERWFELSDKEQNDIWHVLYFFEDKDKLAIYAKEKWGFNEDQATKISSFNLKQGYSNLSRKAINNILPFLIQGHQYDIAVALGGIKNAFGSEWKDMNAEDLEYLDTNVPSIVRKGIKGGYIEPLKEFLTEAYGMNEKQLKRLYHHSSNIEVSELMKLLPVNQTADKEIQSLKNPVVVTALFEIRRLINELIGRFGKLDKIKIEMARDLKISKTKRREIRLQQQRLERENDRVKKELEQIGQRITHDNLLKYKLWEECERTCPFTGKAISVQQLFSGAVQVEHIHPWSRSLNDSFMNKTLCFADENRAKGKKTPYEYYSLQGEGKWEEVKARALSCFKNKKEYPNAYQKFKHFVRVKHDDDFISRQLNDTRYISKEAKNYLSKICTDIQVSPGQVTANLRHLWGLNSILSDENAKSRDDHRHHAIDALVVACTSRRHLNELAKWNSYDRSYELSTFPEPWSGFRNDAEMKVEQILVSHRKNNPVITKRKTGTAARGLLHKETVYGKRKSPDQETFSYHVKKPLESLTTATHISKIVDPVIRKIINERIDALGGYIKGKDVPKNAFFNTDENGKVTPQIFLPNDNGDRVPVLSVRIRESMAGAEQLKEGINKYVNPRNNHHVVIYKDLEGNLQEEVVTFWTVVERANQGQEIFQLPINGKEMVITMEINDLFLLGLNNSEINWNEPDLKLLNNHLYRVQKLSSKDYFFRKHSASTIENKEEEIRSSLSRLASYIPIKVKISFAGFVEQA